MRIIRNTFILLITFFIANTGFTATSADMDKRLDFLYGEHQPYKEFIAQLQHAVTSKDKTAIAQMIRYPLTVNTMQIQSPTAFLKNYDKIIKKEITSAILEQKYENLFANDNGIMLGKKGEV